LLAWIAAGAPRGTPRTLTHFAVSASRDVVERENEKVTLRAVARFADGPEVDVTSWTVFTSSDPSAVSVEEGATTTAATRRRGRHVVLARFLDRAEPLRVTRPLGDQPTDLSAEPTSAGSAST
jgi:hypothetical protein